jgi:restriction system protein
MYAPSAQIGSDGGAHTLKDAVPALADIFQVTDAERTALLPSGQQAILNNRVAWAKTYLNKAGLLEAPRRGVFIITDRVKTFSPEILPR